MPAGNLRCMCWCPLASGFEYDEGARRGVARSGAGMRVACDRFTKDLTRGIQQSPSRVYNTVSSARRGWRKGTQGRRREEWSGGDGGSLGNLRACVRSLREHRQAFFFFSFLFFIFVSRWWIKFTYCTLQRYKCGYRTAGQPFPHKNNVFEEDEGVYKGILVKS